MTEKLIWHRQPSPDTPRFAVRIGRGLVTHWRDAPLTTWDMANQLRQAIQDYTGEVGEVEEERA